MSQRKDHHNGVFVISLADLRTESAGLAAGASLNFGAFQGYRRDLTPAVLTTLLTSLPATSLMVKKSTKYSLTILDYDNVDSLLSTER
jgi:hypothetical protein